VRLDRTQEVAGSSPASSMFKRSCNGSFWFARKGNVTATDAAPVPNGYMRNRGYGSFSGTRAR
jgi:hypothetical protein